MTAQLVILLTSAIAIALLAQTETWLKRWGFLIGLAGQPFWLVETLIAAQWGMFALSCWYTGAYLYGLRKHWSLP